MAHRIVTTIINALKQEGTQDEVHFHADGGRPYPCYDGRCARARFDAG